MTDADTSNLITSVTNPSHLPVGRVTLAFTDVQGSTAAWERFGATFGEALQIHERLIRSAVTANRGHVVKTAGDGFMLVFEEAADAVSACLQIQSALAAVRVDGVWEAVGGIRVRIGLHTGSPSCRDRDYFGPDVNRAARISDAAHGGMILLSETTFADLNGNIPDGVRVKDHSPHRLKDLGDPVRLYELRGADFRDFWTDKPLRTLESLQHNFPVQPTSLVGRQRERDELNALLSTGDCRLITLTGPGGTGKTRLAMQVAADRVQDYPDGAWLVDLSTVRDPDAVPSSIVHSMHVDLAGGQDPQTALLNILRHKRAMLVLDNFEQVADAAVFVGEILRDCARVTCLVTSREVLRLSGEREYTVEPLSSPPSGATQIDWRSYESVQLFLERCVAVRPDFEMSDTLAPVVGEICRRLDGIPLAVELAAARVRVLSPVQILQRLTQRFDLLTSRLRDVPERQQTLRSAIDWSYDLLTEAERSLFCELAVFSGGFSIEAAEAVCICDGAFELVFSLRDKSLLKTVEVYGQTRYSMLETIREYAVQKLQESPNVNELRKRHADYYRAQAEKWSEAVASAGEDSSAALHSMRVDLDNIRNGMDWAAGNNRPDLTVEFGKALFPYLRRHGLYQECDTRLIAAQEAAGELGDDRAVARLLNQRGLLSMERSQLPTAIRLLDESRSISERLEDRVRVIVTSINLGNVYWMLGEFGRAREQWEGALALTEVEPQPRYEAFLRENLGILAAQEGRLDEADEHYAASLSMHEQAGNRGGVASTLYNSSEVSRLRGDYDHALERLSRARAIYDELEDSRGISLSDVRLGLICIDRCEYARARPHLEEGIGVAVVTDNRHAVMYGHEALGRLALAEHDPERARAFFRQAYGLSETLNDRKSRADTLFYSHTLLDATTQSNLLRWLEHEYSAMGVVPPTGWADAVTADQPAPDFPASTSFSPSDALFEPK